MKIRNLHQAKDNDIIYVYDLTGKFICRGHWYNDDVLTDLKENL